MNEHFVVLEQFAYEVSCCCPGQKHQHMFEFYQGDVWFVTEEPKFIDCLGWHFLIDINNVYQFYMHVDDIEALYNKGNICSIMDMELKINHLSFKVNEALDARDSEAFFSYTDELNYMQKIKDKMNYTGVYALEKTK